MKINADFRLFAAKNFDASAYVKSPSYGVNRFMLERIGNEKARATTIVEYRPNSKFPEHTHIGGEEFLVLAGTFKDQHGSFPRGTYVRNPIGSSHAPWVECDGCTIMVKLLQMSETPGEGIAPLHVFVDGSDAKRRRQTTRYGSLLDLYDNERTGERVQMCWVESGKNFQVEDEDVRGGEELFVVDGSLVLPGDEGDKKGEQEKEEEEYAKWGWLRFPAYNCNWAGTDDDDDDRQRRLQQRRSALRAGGSGAQVYRKTGHLTEKALSMEKIRISPDDESVIATAT